jgi:hypothetical protein
MTSLKEAKNKAVRVMTSEARAMNRASNVPGKGLALSIDRDTASVEGDVTAKEKHPSQRDYTSSSRGQDRHTDAGCECPRWSGRVAECRT